MFSVLASSGSSSGSVLNWLDEIALVLTKVVSNITNNAILMTLFCGSLVIMGASVFKKIKKSARS